LSVYPGFTALAHVGALTDIAGVYFTSVTERLALQVIATVVPLQVRRDFF
jgi:hypothetical protein